MNELFRKIASKIAYATGTFWAFFTALGIIIFWALSGSYFEYSNTWQLAINTTTTIATFLMVFLIQNTQNRDSRAVHLKLDELIRTVKGARNSLIDIEEMADSELDLLQEEFQKQHERYQKELMRRQLKSGKQ